MKCFPTITFALLLSSVPAVWSAEVVAVASGDWSNTATWGGTLPGVEDAVKIPAGFSVTLDANIECGGITISGVLEVERANRTLLCDFLLVHGADSMFRVGTSADRFLQKFTLTLKGLPTETAPVMGAKVLGAHNGGTLSIHGRDRVEWTHLGSNAPAGATSLTLIEPVDWVAGDSILVTSSRLNWNEAETRTITSVSADMRTVFFTPGLAYLHNGKTISKTRSTDGKSWTANLRAEVGLLSRNVKIQGDAASETAGFGGHIMVMDGGPTCCASTGKAYIEGVELYRMGQKGIVARYPMHWHMVADGGVGQYFKDSVVRRSFNRAITIHGTESTLVENNFCYDHLGHGLFLEDGSERFNVIRRNVVLGTMRPASGEEILDSDNAFNTVQNRSPASYWITNPNNTFTDNIAAGTHGTGFWFAFPKKPLNASLDHPRFAGLEPYKQPLGVFSGNTAHSCASGLDINDQISASDTLVINGEWANNGPFYFDDCTWYANDIAIYAGIGARRKNVVYRNNVFSDNKTNLFLATYHLCEESLMLADSGFGLLPSSTTRTVYAVYDGAGRMKNNHLAGYHATHGRFLQNIGAATKHPNHYFEGLTFDPPSPVRSVLTNYNIIPPANIGANDPGHPRIWAQVVVDVDGSITGVPNSSIISNHPFMLTGAETRPSVWTHMYRSDHRFAQCRLDYGLAYGSIPNVSVVRTKPGTSTRGVYYINGYNERHQLPLIVRDDFLYTYSYEALPSTRKVILSLDDATVGDHYLVRFKDFGKLPGISVTGMTSRASLEALKAGTDSGFYKETNGDFYVRPVATATQHSYTLTWSSNITMPVVDSDGDGISDGAEAAAGTDPFRAVDGTEPFVNSEFNVAGNFENWGSLSGIASETVTGGVLAAQTTNNDPQMFETNLRIAGSEVPYLLVRMKASRNANAQILWGNLNDPGFASGRSVTANYNGSNEWQVLVFPMHGNPQWQNQVITGLRFDPTTASGVTFEMDWIRAWDGTLISTVPAQTIAEDTATPALPFTLSDTIADDAFVTTSSSNPNLVPNANIVLTGTGAQRTVTVTPVPDGNGTTTISLTVSDGGVTSTSSFLLTVTPVSDPPVKAATGNTLNVGSAWEEGNVPVSPETATWKATSLTGNMSLGGDLNWAGLIVNDPIGTLTFNGPHALTLGSGGIDMSTATTDLTMNHPVILGAAQTWKVAAGRKLTANDAISGPYGITKSGFGDLTLSGVNAFTGNLNISAGSATITRAEALGIGAKTISITNGTAGACELHLNGSSGPIILPANVNFNTSRITGNGAIVNDAGHNQIGGPINMVSGGGSTLVTVFAGSLALNGNVTSNFTGGRTLQLASLSPETNAVNGVIRNGTHVASVMVQSGTWSLTNANTHTGATTVSGGTLTLSGSLASVLNVNGGEFAPRGTPSVAGTISLNESGIYQTRINGATAGTQYDQLTAGGDVTLGGNLNILTGPGLAAGSAFRILNKTSAGSATGMFSGKPEGSAFAEGGYVWTITYTGGDGNDVVLTTATAMQAWRFNHFGTIADAGVAADTFDSDGDGETNLLEFATAQDPHAATLTSTELIRNGDMLEFTYSRGVQALAEGVLFHVEWSDTLAPESWDDVEGPEQIPDENSTLQSVKMTLPTAALGKRFVRLRVTQP